ncbi:MAG: TonB-dependent receptor plug domain-containing protein, partial [Deltaproteobacteria bacterium]|nr:TonB-dependent receptor plug domain-containing protein [Deltaproteobacteria bacterium]
MKINRATHWAVCLGVLCLLVYCTAADAAPASDNESIFSETELMFIGEELYTVSIASRKPEPLRRAPAAVTVIQGEQLKSYRTLAETLRGVPGFFIDRNEVKERIYLRGIPDSFLVMMDGVPFSNDSSTGDYPRGMELSLEYL